MIDMLIVHSASVLRMARILVPGAKLAHGRRDRHFRGCQPGDQFYGFPAHPTRLFHRQPNTDEHDHQYHRLQLPSQFELGLRNRNPRPKVLWRSLCGCRWRRVHHRVCRNGHLVRWFHLMKRHVLVTNATLSVFGSSRYVCRPATSVNG